MCSLNIEIIIAAWTLLSWSPRIQKYTSILPPDNRYTCAAVSKLPSWSPRIQKYTFTLPPPALCFKFLVEPTWGKWFHWIDLRLIFELVLDWFWSLWNISHVHSLCYCVLSITLEVTFHSRKYNICLMSKLSSSLYKSKYIHMRSRSSQIYLLYQI